MSSYQHWYDGRRSPMLVQVKRCFSHLRWLYRWPEWCLVVRWRIYPRWRLFRASLEPCRSAMNVLWCAVGRRGVRFRVRRSIGEVGILEMYVTILSEASQHAYRKWEINSYTRTNSTLYGFVSNSTNKADKMPILCFRSYQSWPKYIWIQFAYGMSRWHTRMPSRCMNLDANVEVPFLSYSGRSEYFPVQLFESLCRVVITQRKGGNEDWCVR